MKYTTRFNGFTGDYITVEADNEKEAYKMAVNEWYIKNNIKVPEFVERFNAETSSIIISEKSCRDMMIIDLDCNAVSLLEPLDLSSVESILYKESLFTFTYNSYIRWLEKHNIPYNKYNSTFSWLLSKHHYKAYPLT